MGARRRAVPVERGAGGVPHVGAERVRPPHAFRIDGSPSAEQLQAAARWLAARNAGLRKVMVFVNADGTVIGGWATDHHDELVPEIARGVHEAVGGSLRFDRDLDPPGGPAFLDGFPEEFTSRYLRSLA